jgi:hypothetical protein
MNQEEIKAKSAELAAFYTAKANGKTLQIEYSDGWKDCVTCNGPSMHSNFSRWRVKPEPRRCWLSLCGMSVSGVTFDESVATRWKQQGMKVTEWVEVLP